ncbi:MAG TPA: hypothetical protein VFK57_09075 [Vicinamibacterales bacterium]|nr:hypothetical protein [Vicinamibacterales bacterium]
MRMTLHLPHFLLLTRVAMCAIGMTLFVACGQRAQSPVSPTASGAPEPDAAADGSTLKVPAPSTNSPAGGGQVQAPLVLVASTVTPKFGAAALTYRFEVRSGSTVVTSGNATSSGSSVSFTPAALDPDTNFTWRVRAESGGAFGPWSGDAAFRSPVGAYIRGNEIRDPLTIGRTVGTPIGAVQFVKDGVELLTQESRVTYQLPVTLEAGEFSAMVTGFDEGSPGDKSKIFSMQEGGGDITTNDYRFTVEKRGRSYSIPGAVTYRIIVGGGEHAIFDGARLAVNFSDERWYFWKATWGANFANVEVREDSPTGRVIYNQRVNTNHSYRPSPHMIHLGAPVGRAGPIDASIPGTIYKNVYVGPGPRPNFPN